jgi:NADH:ubiquinone oxidoreductase subunit 6 (subunit J)
MEKIILMLFGIYAVWSARRIVLLTSCVYAINKILKDLLKIE